MLPPSECPISSIEEFAEDCPWFTMYVLVFRFDQNFAGDIIHMSALDLDDSIAQLSFSTEPIGFVDDSNDVVILYPRRPSGSKHRRKDWGFWAKRIDASRGGYKLGIAKEVWVLANK